jgi:hypothetical protein
MSDDIRDFDDRTPQPGKIPSKAKAVRSPLRGEARVIVGLAALPATFFLSLALMDGFGKLMPQTPTSAYSTPLPLGAAPK